MVQVRYNPIGQTLLSCELNHFPFPVTCILRVSQLT